MSAFFGSRFIRGSRVVDYLLHKLLINRLANLFVKLLFALDSNDITNAFKCFRQQVIDAMQPLISPRFNLTLEMHSRRSSGAILTLSCRSPGQ
jgi:dolichol-phosphate mannosyltransferase